MSARLIQSLDHLVLTVASIDATVAFYCGILGMERTRFGDGRTALVFGDQKINLHQAGREFEPKALHPTPGSGDLCFLSARPLGDVIAGIEATGTVIEDGPVARSGARGPITSIYLRDPDGNLVEISEPA
ncbi:MAG: VOC family protein [Pseudomonadota bacterium]